MYLCFYSMKAVRSSTYWAKEFALQSLNCETRKGFFIFNWSQWISGVRDRNKRLNYFQVKILFTFCVCISSFTIWWMWENYYGGSSGVFEILIRAMKLSVQLLWIWSCCNSSIGTLPTREQKNIYNGHIHSQFMSPVSDEMSQDAQVWMYSVIHFKSPYISAIFLH